MRPIRSLVLSSCLLLLAACGEKPAAPGVPSEPGGAEPEAQVLTGPVVRIAYEAREGEGVRLRQQMDSTMQMTMDGETQTVPMTMRVVMLMRCISVEEGGDRLVESTFEEFAMPGAAAEMEGLAGMKARSRIGPDGSVRSMAFEGADQAWEGALRKALQGGGFNTFLPVGTGGLRVGQALDVRDLFPLEQLKEALSGLPAAPGTFEPAVAGSYTFKGTRTFAGGPAAEFDVDLTLSLMRDEGDADPVVQVEISGTQYVDLRTGWPAGTSTLKQTMTMASDGAGGMAVRMEGETRVTAEPLAK